MANEKMVTIKLVKSPNGRKPNQSLTLKALGLTKRNQIVIKIDNEPIRGMIETVKHLIEVIE
jgi:large subunit ribosomal protein L30